MIWMRLPYGYAAPNASSALVGLAPCGPRGFCEDAKAERYVAECAHLRGERARVVARVAAGEVRFNNDRLGQRRTRGTARRQGDDREPPPSSWLSISNRLSRSTLKVPAEIALRAARCERA